MSRSKAGALTYAMTKRAIMACMEIADIFRERVGRPRPSVHIRIPDHVFKACAEIVEKHLERKERSRYRFAAVTPRHGIESTYADWPRLLRDALSFARAGAKFCMKIYLGFRHEYARQRGMEFDPQSEYFPAQGTQIVLAAVGFVFFWAYLFLSVIVPASLFILTFPAFMSVVPSLFSHAESVAVISLFGVILYRLRCRQLFLYGYFEIVASLVAIWFAVTNHDAQSLSRGIGILGAVYIMVRGLDNIDKSMPRRGLQRVFWNIAFHYPWSWDSAIDFVVTIDSVAIRNRNAKKRGDGLAGPRRPRHVSARKAIAYHGGGS